MRRMGETKINISGIRVLLRCQVGLASWRTMYSHTRTHSPLRVDTSQNIFTPISRTERKRPLMLPVSINGCF
jgi:hypothetical protein